MRLTLLFSLMFLTLAPVQPAPPAQALCFDVPAIGNCIDQRFRAYWEDNGGLPVFGYPISPTRPEQTPNETFLT